MLLELAISFHNRMLVHLRRRPGLMDLYTYAPRVWPFLSCLDSFLLSLLATALAFPDIGHFAQRQIAARWTM